MPSSPPILPPPAVNGVPATPPSPIAPPPPLHHPAAADVIPVDPAMPPTSPQHHQQAARHHERLQHQIGSPEQRRIPAAPAGPSRLPAPAQPEPVIFDGHLYTNLPADLAALDRVVAAQSHQPALPTTAHASGHVGAPQPFPFHFPPPPPPAPAVGSSSVSVSALGSGSVSHSALGPAFSLADSQPTLTAAELIAQRALLPPLQPPRRYNRRQHPTSVS